MGTIVFFFPPGVKWLGYGGGHIPEASAEVQNDWSYMSMTPGCLCGIKREHCTFTCPFTIWDQRVPHNAGWEMVVCNSLDVIYIPSMNPGYTANTSVLGSTKYWKLICCCSRAVGNMLLLKSSR